MRLRRSFYYSFGRTGGQLAIQFAANVALARLLSPSEMGIYAVALAAVAMLGALREFGVGAYLVKEADLTADKLRTVFAFSLIVGWGLAGALFLGRDALAAFYGEPQLSPILSVLALTFILLPFGQPAIAVLRREHRHGDLALIALAGGFGGAAISIGLAYLGFGPISMAYGALAGGILTTGLALRAKPEHLRLRPSLKEWRGVMGFGSLVSVSAIVVQLGTQAPSLVLGWLMGFADVGLFMRASALARLFWAQSVHGSNWVTGSALGAQHRSGADMSSLTLRVTDNLCVIGWPILAFLVLKAEAIVLLLYGHTWLPAAALLPPLCVAIAIQMLMSQAGPVYEGTGAMALYLRNQLAVQLAAVAFLVIGAQISLEAVAWLRVPSALVMVLVHLTVFRRYMGVGLGPLLVAVRRAGLLAALFALALWAVIRIEPSGTVPAPIILSVEIVIAAVLHLGLIYVLRHPLRSEISLLLGRIVPRPPVTRRTG